MRTLTTVAPAVTPVNVYRPDTLVRVVRAGLAAAAVERMTSAPATGVFVSESLT